MKIRYLVEGDSEPREVEEPNFNFSEYKDLLLGKITDEHGNALNDVFIGKRSYKKIAIKWLEVIEEQPE
ncbi:hypothetical protein ITX49_08800 [Enterococcus casseliflavus]|uniref:hypothetical protein n=1 Tax=Enterococcus TaxID=1350 RepID=UPI001CBC3A13|nr:hypothetical protein [Enterococcus casseliflavus]MBZ3641273.1 hypothetical protein [Enterococcus casseliflavus]